MCSSVRSLCSSPAWSPCSRPSRPPHPRLRQPPSRRPARRSPPRPPCRRQQARQRRRATRAPARRQPVRHRVRLHPGLGHLRRPGRRGFDRGDRSWKTNAVRVPLNEDCWLGINGVDAAYGGANYRKAIGDYVTRLHAAGFVVILDLHWPRPARPRRRRSRMADADHAPDVLAVGRDVLQERPRGDLRPLQRAARHLVAVLARRLHNLGGVADGRHAVARQRGARHRRDAADHAGRRSAGPATSSQWLAYRPNDPLNQLVASFHIYNFSAAPAELLGQHGRAGRASGAGRHRRDRSGRLRPRLHRRVHGLGRQGTLVPRLDLEHRRWLDVHQRPVTHLDYNGTPTNFGVGLKQHLAEIR